MKWKAWIDWASKNLKKPRHLKNIVKLELSYVLCFVFVLLRPLNINLFSDIRYLVLLLPCIVINAPNNSAGANIMSSFLIAVFSVTTTYTGYGLLVAFSPISDGLVLFGFATITFILGLLRAYFPRQLSSAVTIASFLFISEIANGHFDYEKGTLSIFRPHEYIKVCMLGILISLVVNLFVFPYWAGDYVRKRFKKSMRSLAVLLRTEIDVFQFYHHEHIENLNINEFAKTKKSELKDSLKKAQAVFSEITNYMRYSQYEVSYSYLSSSECNVIMVYIKKLLQHLVIVAGICDGILDRSDELPDPNHPLNQALELFLLDAIGILRYIYGCIDKNYAEDFQDKSDDYLPNWMNENQPAPKQSFNWFSTLFSLRKRKNLDKLLRKFSLKPSEVPRPKLLTSQSVSLEEECEKIIKQLNCKDQKLFDEFYFLLALISFYSRLKEFSSFIADVSSKKILHIPFLYNHESYERFHDFSNHEKIDEAFIQGYLTGIYNPLNLVPKHNEKKEQDFGRTLSMKSIQDYYPFDDKKNKFLVFLSRFFQQFKTDAFKYALRCAIVQSAILAMAFSPKTANWFDNWRVLWALVTACVVMTPTVGESNLTGLWRIIGTTIGGLWGLITWAIFGTPSRWPGILVMTIIIGFFVSLFQECTNYYRRVATVSLLSFNIVLMGKYTQDVYELETGQVGETIYDVALKRTVAVMFGSVFSMIATSIVLPVFARDKLRIKISEAIHGFGLHFATLASSLEKIAENGLHCFELPLLKIRKLEFHLQEILVETNELIETAKTEISLYEETLFPTGDYKCLLENSQSLFNKLILGRLLWNDSILKNIQWGDNPRLNNLPAFKSLVFQALYCNIMSILWKTPHPFFAQSIIDKKAIQACVEEDRQFEREDLVFITIQSITNQMRNINIMCQKLFGTLDFKLK